MNDIEIINNFLKLFNQMTCVICDNPSRKLGYCNDHYDIIVINKIQTTFNNMILRHLKDDKTKISHNVDVINQCIKSDTVSTYTDCDMIQYLKRTDVLIFKNYISPLKKKITSQIKLLQSNLVIKNNHQMISVQAYLSNLINLKYDFSDPCKLYDSTNQIIHIDYEDMLKYINECMDNYIFEEDIEWDNLTDSEIECKVISNAHENNYFKQLYNESNKMIFLKIKLLEQDIDYLSRRGYIKCQINNNHICTSKLIQNCDKLLYISMEYNIIINKTTYRCDMYVVVRTKRNKALELCIEIDEDHHFFGIIESDILKDIFIIKNGMSMMRYYCKSNKFNDNDLKIIIDFINNIYESDMPRYYFSLKYLNHKKKLLNNKKKRILDLSNDFNKLIVKT
jgi:hypothetical protein